MRPKISPLIAASRRLAESCRALSYGAPVARVYHPLVYAREPHELYLSRYAAAPKKAIFLGINPGPWGMGQTGVPFGDVASVRDYLGVCAPVRSPENPHPKRPVEGFACRRREISGSRLWALFRDRYGPAPDFFADRLLLNYCPVLFFRENGAAVSNLTPDKLAAADRQPLYAACDAFMRVVAESLRPRIWIGVGGFAERRLRDIFGDDAAIAKIPHPSPASPAANRDFAAAASRELAVIDRRLGSSPRRPRR